MTGTALMKTIPAFACLGAVAGLAYFMLLSWNVRALLGQSRNHFAAAASLSRAALMAGALAFSAFHGAVALSAMLVGFLLSRAILLGRPELFLP